MKHLGNKINPDKKKFKKEIDRLRKDLFHNYGKITADRAGVETHQVYDCFRKYAVNWHILKYLKIVIKEHKLMIKQTQKDCKIAA